MERTCFAFKENKHNHCECACLKKMICKEKDIDCPFYRHKSKVNTDKIEEEIVEYAKEKN